MLAGYFEMDFFGTGPSANPNQSTRFWADLGLSARARLLPAAWLAFELQAGAVAPLTRYTLDFHDPDGQLYRVPAVGGRIQFGVAGRIP